MTVKDGKYYWEAPAGKVPTQIIISDNGGTKAGGGDLNYVNGATYNADGTTCDSPTPPVPSGDSVVYFDNSATNWSTVKVHYWGGTSATSWPGKDMEAVTDSIYKCTVADGTTGLVFNNGAGDQSVNLTFVKGHLYDKNSDKGEYK